ncbi:MAG: DNA adenine methylase [Campylobacterales bacterium]|nr:DNA adenine methylase [Campylobacterales bacterium]
MTFPNTSSISDYSINTIIPQRTIFSTTSKSIDTFNIQQRRYLGNKFNVLSLIDEVINNEIGEFESFCDIFAGTGVVGHYYNTPQRKIISNDLLFSNYITHTAFLGCNNIDNTKISKIINELNRLNSTVDNYASLHFGGRYFTLSTARHIGEIREKINQIHKQQIITFQEKSVLLTSLLYAMDRIANTVGHYDAYIKKEVKRENFILKMPNIKYEANHKNINYNKDANILIRQIECDVLYIDPPYNSRQYSDSYHLLENIMRWEKPEVHGEARKFDRKHLKSDYSLKNATKAFADLIENAKCKYILFSYNNMADKGNNRSNARMNDNDILEILNRKGNVKIFEQSYKEFTTGKSDRGDNKERVFFVEVIK